MSTVTVVWRTGLTEHRSEFTVPKTRTQLPPVLEVSGYYKGELSGSCVAELSPVGVGSQLIQHLYCGSSPIPCPPMAGVLKGWAPGWQLISSPDGSSLWLICPPTVLPPSQPYTPTTTSAPMPTHSPLPQPRPTPTLAQPTESPVASSLSFLASQQAAQDELSKAYVGNDIPPEVKSKRDFLFSDLGKAVCERLQVDDVALHSVSPHWMADKICNAIMSLVGPTATITDGTACVGGDTIRFAKKFAHVNAVELSEQRAKMLYHNVKAAGVGAKVHVYHSDYVKLGPSMEQDVVFMDPPWGGPEYRTAKSLDMFLGPTPLIEVCRRLWVACPRTRYFVLKLPQNFNVSGFEAALPSQLPGSGFTCSDIGKALLAVIRRV